MSELAKSGLYEGICADFKDTIELCFKKYVEWVKNEGKICEHLESKARKILTYI